VNKKLWISLAVLLLGLVCFIWAIRYIGVDQILEQFHKIRPEYILLYLTISTMIVVVLIIKWRIILGALGYHINFLNLVMYRQMGYAVGYVVPAFYIGGETVRSYFLNKKHNVPLRDSVSSVVIDRAVELPMNFLLAAAMFFIIILTMDISPIIMVPMGLVIAFMVFITAFFYFKMYKKEYFFTYIFDLLRLGRIKKLAPARVKTVHLEESVIKFFNHKPKYIILSILISGMLWLLMMVEFWTGMRIVGYNPTFVQVFLVIVMTGFTMAIPIPASVGVMELGQIGICLMMGIPAPVAIALSLLVRTRDLLWILMGLGYYIYSGTDYMKMVLKDMDAEEETSPPTQENAKN
jgi:uncharacterized protein (TIRG00374 family)